MAKSMKFSGKKLLFIDIETSGLPLARKGVRRIDKYPSPSINIPYDRSRLLTFSCISCGGETRKVSLGRLESELSDDCYTANKGKYHGTSPMSTIANEVITYFKECDYVIGHNVLFDLNIIANEARRLEHPLYDVIVQIIDNCKYFCTITMAKLLGIDDCGSKLREVVTKLNTGDNYKNITYKYHESDDDTLATKFIFDIGTKLIDIIPESIDAITDTIYEPVIIGDRDLVPNLFMRVPPFAFYFYKKSLSAKLAIHYASGRAEYFIENGLGEDYIFTSDGVFQYNSVIIDCHFINGCEYTCDKCSHPILGVGLCRKCVCDDEFRKAEEFKLMPANFDEILTINDFKKLRPEVGRRMSCLDIETQRKGRSLMLPKNKVDFYLDNSIYKYFSLKIGASKY
jgi:DNA polymerase III epsilon subunit-like protein